MEISVIGSSQVNLGRINDVGFCNFSKNLNASVKIFNAKNNNNNINNNNSKGQIQSFVWPSRSATGFCLRASASPHTQAVVPEKASKFTGRKPNANVKLYVGLPLDTVSNANTINHAKAIAAGLKALKLLGVDGVELPVWWGVAESEAMGKYDWTGYLAIVEIVRKLDLKLHVSLCFHASKEAKISLPQWVSRIGESDPSIYFADRSGQTYKNCLSLGVDDLPVLDGKTPLQVYTEFCENFKSFFLPYMGSTITGLSIGLGPDGELRYPSYHHPSKSNIHPGAGEFQCYDKNMLNDLKHHAETSGNPLWGLGGPHDAPGYHLPPLSGGFFAEHGGSWETPYGDFFLSWYASRLIQHGDQLLSVAASTFKDVPITLFGKIPLMHSWCKARSHPSELTAGIYNTVHRDGYDAILEIVSRNACKLMLPGLDFSDEDQPTGAQSSPETLLAQITSSCKARGIPISGENSSLSGFEQIKKYLLDENAAVDLFTYQRMGAYFFSPKHFPSFTQFVRGIKQPMQSLDVLPVDGGDKAESLSGTDLQMQAA